MAKQVGNCWLSRDTNGNGQVGLYCISKKRPKRKYNIDGPDYVWLTTGASVEIEPLLFHRLFPTTRLKLGQGPHRAHIAIEF